MLLKLVTRNNLITISSNKDLLLKVVAPDWLRITAVQEFYCTHCSEQYTPCVLQRGTSAGAVLRNWGRRRAGKGMLLITLRHFDMDRLNILKVLCPSQPLCIAMAGL